MTESSPAVRVEEPSEYAVPPGPRTSVLVTLALAWLTAILWFARGFTNASITADGSQQAAVSAAIALPTVVAASLLAGSAVGLATVSVLTARAAALVRRTLSRLAVAAVTGLIVGGLAGASIVLTWHAPGSVTSLAVALALAGVIGALLAAALPAPVATAGSVATLAVFVTGFAINYLFRERLMNLFGAGNSASSQYNAFWLFALTTAVLTGLVGGVMAFWRLRRGNPAADGGESAGAPGTAAPDDLADAGDRGEDRDEDAAGADVAKDADVMGGGVAGGVDGVRTGGAVAPTRWPAYLIAGAIPGIMLLLAEAVTRLGGSQLLELAGSNEADRTAFAWAGESRMNHALVVLFLGAIVATIGFGRTLPPRSDAARDGGPVDDDTVDSADRLRAADADDNAGTGTGTDTGTDTDLIDRAADERQRG